MEIAYVRVSTAEQNEARQVEALKKYKIDRWYIEKASGKKMDRKELRAMLDYARDGDTIHIHDFSRLARNTRDLLDIVELLENKGVTLMSDKENFDTRTPTGKLLVVFLAALYDFECVNMRERQKEGIACAKAAGKYKGGHPRKIDDKLWTREYAAYMSRQITKKEFAARIGVSRPTLDKLLKEKLSQ